MQEFKHASAASYRVDYQPAQGGGLIARTLVVKAGIALEPGPSDYSADKVKSLTAAAVSYAKRRGIPEVLIEGRGTS